ncbi:MAG: hypothetical protein H3C51_05655 [Rubellimicrobium sp.]|nr:hypothetical protein [Rubellimicrobium sp.]
MRILSAVALSAAMATGLAFAGVASAQDAAPPPAPFQKVSDLVALPDFIPGLGELFVDPATLPAGPFLAYDHDGNLAATVYMVPIAALEDGTAYTDLPLGDDTVTSVDVMYNAGHPGVEEPHVHVILYHGEDAKSRIAE